MKGNILSVFFFMVTIIEMRFETYRHLLGIWSLKDALQFRKLQIIRLNNGKFPTEKLNYM